MNIETVNNNFNRVTELWVEYLSWFDSTKVSIFKLQNKGYTVEEIEVIFGHALAYNQEIRLEHF